MQKRDKLPSECSFLLISSPPENGTSNDDKTLVLTPVQLTDDEAMTDILFSPLVSKNPIICDLNDSETAARWFIQMIPVETIMKARPPRTVRKINSFVRSCFQHCFLRRQRKFQQRASMEALLSDSPYYPQ